MSVGEYWKNANKSALAEMEVRIASMSKEDLQKLHKEGIAIGRKKALQEVVGVYKGMWEWIARNVESLRQEYDSIRDVKEAYLLAPYRKIRRCILTVFGDCLLCATYNCSQYDCPLVNCTSSVSAYGTLKRYWHEKYIRKTVPVEEARKSCERIVKMHEDILKNPTQRLLKKLEDV